MPRDIFQDGGTAFPWVAEFEGPCTNLVTGQPVNAGTVARHYFSGMTLRDYFAAKAMQAMVSDTVAMGKAAAQTRQLLDEMIARTAYLYADAMLKERAK